MIGKLIEYLNYYYLFQWVGDYNKCLIYSKKLEEIKKGSNVKLDSIILDEINKVNKSVKQLADNLKYIEENPDH